MARAQTAQSVPTMEMQGIVVPASSVNPAAFFALTRRLTITQKTIGTFAGLGGTDQVPMLQTGIISGLSLKFSGSLVVTPNTGTVRTTARWPYDLIRAVRFSANGQSNLVNCSGWKLKARDIMARGDLTDRGIAQGIGGASPGTSRTNGTLSLSSESWGVGQNVTAIAGGTYAVELDWYVPIAFDEIALVGAIFAQTSSTDLNLAIDWAPPADLFVLTNDATAVLTGSVNVAARIFSIPEVNGEIVVPDLSTFHSYIQSRNTAIANGDNEVRLAGQGVGRQLMRVLFQTWNGSPSAPLALNATNYGQLGWRYGGNDTPEIVTDGLHLRYFNERVFCSDLGAFQGMGVWDFASEYAFRDSIDEGAASELRLLIAIPAGVALTNPVVEYVQETVFAGPAAA